jgi:hypothetical protein
VDRPAAVWRFWGPVHWRDERDPWGDLVQAPGGRIQPGGAVRGAGRPCAGWPASWRRWRRWPGWRRQTLSLDLGQGGGVTDALH